MDLSNSASPIYIAPGWPPFCSNHFAKKRRIVLVQRPGRFGAASGPADALTAATRWPLRQGVHASGPLPLAHPRFREDRERLQQGHHGIIPER
jgi:hypothetical protein